MPLSDEQRTKLLSALEAHGWRSREAFTCAPSATIWLYTSEPWIGDLQEFHERMSTRVARLEAAREMYSNDDEHEQVVGDTRSLVDVLDGLLAE